MDMKRLMWIIVGIVGLFFVVQLFTPDASNGSAATGKGQPAVAQTTESIPYDQVQNALANDPQSITRLTFITDANGTVREVVVERKDKAPAKAVVPGEAGSARLLDAAARNNVPHDAVQAPAESPSGGTIILALLIQLLPMILIGLFIFWIFGRMARAGGQMQNKLGQSGARKIEPSADKKTFADVAGVDEAKRELQEVVDYLKDPGLLAHLGGKPPKGVLLVGSPGNGKTLLAKAVAGEANAAFFAISASQFVEMFVGVGAARVRELFETARQNRPAIIFIDEIDAVGRQRGAGIGGGHDEREQTLNQLLVEMDGFTANTAIILMAATNRPDILDPALLRPGRFDLQVLVDHPDLTGRVAILKVHTRGKKLADDVSLELLAQRTPGFSGAELEGVTNQGAIVAARRIRAEIARLRKEGKKEQEINALVPRVINMADLDEGVDRVQMGPAKSDRAKAMSRKDMENTAYHEVGHAWISQVMHDLDQGGDPVTKITIVPRARALGYTQSLPKGDRYNYTDKELLARIMMAMGGRVAQEVFLNTVDTGAQNDFQQGKNIAYRMVTEFGMSELGPISVSENGSNPFLGRTMAMSHEPGPALKDQIDAAWVKIVNECYRKARLIIEQDRDCFERVVKVLLEKETILGPEWMELRAQSKCATCPKDVVAQAEHKCAKAEGGDCGCVHASVDPS